MPALILGENGLVTACLTGTENQPVITAAKESGTLTSNPKNGFTFTPEGTGEQPSTYVARPGTINQPSPQDFLCLADRCIAIPQSIKQIEVIDRNHPKGSLPNSRLNPDQL